MAKNITEQTTKKSTYQKINSVKSITIKLAERFHSAGSTMILAMVLLVMVILFSSTSPYFLNFKNAMDIGRSIAIIGIAAIGETVVIISGGLDLSIASTMAAAGLLTARLLRSGVPIPSTILIVLVLGSIIGLINGILITRLRINSFITTLATMSIIRGVGYIFSGGLSELIASQAFRNLGRGYIPIIKIPIPVVLLIFVCFLGYMLLRYTKFGRYVYAIGGNETAVRLAGVDVDRWKLVIYMFCSTMCAFAGIVMAATAGSSFPNAAIGREMDIIAGVILGGTSLFGGEGTILGTFMGVMVLGTLTNGMILLNISSYWQQVVKGIILLLAVLIDAWRVRRH